MDSIKGITFVWILFFIPTSPPCTNYKIKSHHFGAKPFVRSVRPFHLIVGLLKIDLEENLPVPPLPQGYDGQA
jgi:hypothetical protein